MHIGSRLLSFNRTTGQIELAWTIDFKEINLYLKLKRILPHSLSPILTTVTGTYFSTAKKTSQKETHSLKNFGSLTATVEPFLPTPPCINIMLKYIFEVTMAAPILK